MPDPLRIPAKIRSMIEAGALVAINHSGGKDSQAMTLRLLGAGIPRDQILIIHASLGEVEWPGTITHIKRTTHGLPLLVTRADKTFFDMVRVRGMFPSPKYRQCTSDLKRGPIEKALRRYLKDQPHFGGRVISAMGMRAEESSSRSKRPVVQASARNSKAGRRWINWLPIHDMSETEVFATITAGGQKPHWAYAKGMSRLSCSFCIMSSRADLACAARLRPRLFDHYAQLERDLDHTLSPSGRPLPELVCC